MLQPEKTDLVLTYLEEHRSASVKQIAKDLFMSETTVRRTLTLLEQQHIVRRSYGFAVLLKYRNNTIPINLRRNDYRKEKAAIAAKAVNLIKTGDTIFIDESSTSGIIAELLDPSLEITVVTNSLATAGILADKRIRTYCTGGLILPDTASFVGNLPELLINVINADICFFSSSGISENGLICDQMAENAQTKRAMLSHSARKVYLCDHSKFDSSYTFIISSAADIDCLISDTEPPEKLKNLFKEIV